MGISDAQNYFVNYLIPINKNTFIYENKLFVFMLIAVRNKLQISYGCWTRMAFNNGYMTQYANFRSFYFVVLAYRDMKLTWIKPSKQHCCTKFFEKDFFGKYECLNRC